MSLVETAKNWFQKTVGWSNSRQSWEERLGALALGLVGLGLWYFGGFLDATQLAILGGLLILALAFLLRRGLFKLFGPVLFYDMVRIARRSRYIWLRLGYAGVLIFFLFTTWMGMEGSQGSQKSYTLLAEIYFTQFMFIQLIAVSMLTPAYVAGSIADEKDRKTLEFMLATDLRNREIVLGKLVARLANLTLFILIGLPILSILQFLGGVDPNLVLAGFLATFVTMLGLGGFSILCSVQMKKPRDAIAVAYLGPLTYLAVGLVLYVLQHWGGLFLWSVGWGDFSFTLREVVQFFNSGNLVVVLIMLLEAIYSNRLQTVLPQLLRDYCLFQGLVGLTCAVWAVVRLRAIALDQAHGTAQKTRHYHKVRGEVGALPMLWKETQVEGNIRYNWLARIFVALLFVLTVGGGLWGIIYALLEGAFFDEPQGFRQGVNIWMRTAGMMVGSLLLLGVAVRASTAISSEKDKDTLDALLTTPLDSDTILWAKFWGCLYSMRRGLLWLGTIWAIALVAGGVQVFFLPFFLAALVTFAAAYTILGLWYSLVSKSSMRATVWTIMTLVALAGGHWFLSFCCGVLVFFNRGGDFPETLLRFQVGITPPAVLWILPMEGFEFRHDYSRSEFLELLGFSLLGTFLYGMASLIFWTGFLSPRFRQFTHREDFLFPREEPSPARLKYQQEMEKDQSFPKEE